MSAPAPPVLHPFQGTLAYGRRCEVSSLVTERAYEVYAHLHGTSQSLGRLNERGGLGTGELLAFLYAWPFPKAEWGRRSGEAMRGMKL